MDFEEVKRTAVNIGKQIIRSRVTRKIAIVAVIVIAAIIILVSGLMLIYHKDTAGTSDKPAAVPFAAQKIIAEAGISQTTAKAPTTTQTTISNYEKSGDGYDSTTTVGDKTYRNYKQYDNGNTYSGSHYWEGTIKTDGCGPTSVAIVLSGYKFDYNPGQVVSIMQNELGYDDSSSFSHLTETLKHIGNIETEEYPGEGTTKDISIIRENFKAGRPVIINAPGHYVVYLGEDSNGNLIISDPGRNDGGNDRYGATLEDVINNGNITCGYILIKSDLNSSSNNTKTTEKANTTKTTDISSNGDAVVQVAIACHKYLRENGYTYGGGYSIPEGIYNQSKIVDCSTFTAWVYYCAGYNNSIDGTRPSSMSMYDEWSNIKFYDESQAQPGDLLVEDGHYEIVAQVENGKVIRVYNCGSTNSIQSEGTDEYPETTPRSSNSLKYVLRPPDTRGSINSLPEGYTASGGSSNGGATSSTVSINAYGHIVENGRGGYKINIDLDAKVDEMMKALEEDGNNPIKNYLKTEKNRKEYLKSMLQAAIVNRYPDLRTKSEIENDTKIPDGEVQGVIKVKRRTKDTSDNDEGEILQYIQYEDYNKLKEKSDKSIFKYFTIDTSGQIVVAGYEERTVKPQEVDCGGDPNYVEGDVEDKSLKPMYKITDSKINYSQQTEKYSMPFDLLWTLLVYSGDEDFVYDLAKLVMDSEIVITVHDNITHKDVEDVQTYVKNYHNKEKETFTDVTDLSYEKYNSKTYDDYRPEEKYNYTVTNKYTYESNNPSIAVTYANSWTMKYEAKYKKTTEENTNKDENTQEDEKNYTEDKKKSKSNMSENEMRKDSKSLLPQREKTYKSELDQYYKSKLEGTSDTSQENYKRQLDDEYSKQLEDYKKKLKEDKVKDYDKQLKEFEEKQNKEKENKLESYKKQINEQKESSMQKVKCNIKDITLTYYSKYTNQKNTVTTVTKKYEYKSQPGKTSEKTDPSDDEDNFVKLLKKHSDAKESLDTLSNWFFKSMEDQESICDMLDLIKYLLYKVDDKDYGITEFDFEEYNPGEMKNIKSGSVSINGGTIQEMVWNALVSAGFSEYSTAGVMGNINGESGFDPAIIESGNGIGYGLCQWSFGRRTNYEAYAASKGKEPSDVNTQIEFLLGDLDVEGYVTQYNETNYLNSCGRNGYGRDSWLNAKSPEEAAKAFSYWYEGPASYDSRRETWAREFYEKYH